MILEGFQILPSLIHEKGLFSEKSYAAGEFIFSVDVYTEKLQPINVINHSCAPNSRIEGKNFFAIRPIAQSTEITFDYDEFKLDAYPWSFRCECGSPKCKRQITGGMIKTIDNR